MVGKQRNFGLDVTRSVSILLVLAAHRYTLNYELGIVGVQIFFVLSGFLIGQILLKQYAKAISVKSVFDFWKRRWFRILPMYYLVLVLKIIVYGNPFGWKMIVYFLFLQANFVGISFFGVSWSLVVEEWFYIILPFILYVVFKLTPILKKQLILLLFASIFFLVVRFMWNSFGKGVIVFQFDCLLLGVVLAYMKIYFNDFYKKLSSFYLFIIGLVGVVLMTIILGDISILPLKSPFYRVIWYFIISIIISIMIPFVENNRIVNIKMKKVKLFYYFFTITSILTYSIYLLHMEIFRMINFNLNDCILLIIQLIILYVICAVAYIIYEHPMLSLRDNFSLKQYIQTIKSVTFKL